MNNDRKTPRIDPEDPKWTAYVLGELEGAQRLEIEQLLEVSEEARSLVEELAVATASMKEELSSLTPLMMTPEQRASIREAAKPARRTWLQVFPSNWGLGLAAAAIIVLAVVVPLGFRNPEPPAPVRSDTSAANVSVKDPVKLPEVTITHNEQEAPEVSKENKAVAISRPAREDRSAGVAVAPVITAEEFAAIAQGGPALAQSSTPTPAPAATGQVAGTVQDPSSALIPGVTITATNNNTGVTAATVTNESGAFTFPTLPAGTYQVTAALQGFQTQTVKDLPVGANDRAQVNYTLQVGSIDTKVEVRVAPTSVLGTSATVGEVLPVKQVQDQLPIVGNNVLELVQIMPGVRQGAEQTAQAVRSDFSNVTRDGISPNDRRENAAPPPPPPAPLASVATPLPPAAAGGARGGGGGRGAAAPAAGPGQGAGVGRGNGTGVSPGVTAGIVGGVVGGTLGSLAAAPPPPAVFADRVNIPTPNTEAYDRITDNPFVRTTQQNLATFSIDVDTAAYANVRRFLNQNQLPPRDAVRIEELINYFSYDYAQPSGNAPIAPNMEVAAAPWNQANRLLRVGIKARDVNANRRPPSNLVFLIDVSGSMNSPERLPLVKAGLNMLVERLGENDLVSMVVYAGNSGLVLAPTSGMRKEIIRQAIDRLQAGGSTNGASGIQLAYNQATANFLRGGVNRVILMTDGDFNVGVTSQGDLTRLIEEKAKSGVFLSVLGFGMGNLKDNTMERLADQGNGHYAYIDSLNEARKVLVEEMSGTLVTVAKDVKIQVDFNPSKVEAYRLIGYENRVLRTEDFNNDAKDAGDMGAGHTVTALFEIVPKGGEVPGPSIDPSKYTQTPVAPANASSNGASSNELLTLRVRYKQPDSDTSTRMDIPFVDRGGNFARATTDFRFAASVAEFGMILRDSPYKGSSRMDTALDIAESSQGQDPNGYRKEFISLVQKARNLGR